MKNLKSVFSRLGINESNGLYITKEDVWKKELSLPSRVERLLENELQPDAFFVFDQKPLILFFDSPVDSKNTHRAIWNFNESPIAIIANDYDIEIFNGFNLNKSTELLESFGKSESLDDFSYFQLVTGKTWEQHEKELSYENRVDYLLLKNIKAAREVIAPGLNNTKSKLANAIIGKAIFVRYLIDRHVTLNFDGVSKTWSNNEFCELLSSPTDVRRFFEYLESKDKGFNGDLFRINTTDYDRLTTGDFNVIKRLLAGEDIVRGQRSLFDFYDFSIIPIEFISNVYELFIGQDNQKKEGAYYTPLFLVDYILKETVENHLSNRKSGDVPEDFTYCRVLDPACGSGIFLVETLRKIIEQYKKDTQIDVKSGAFKNAIKELAKANIFGIDKDESAVQVAIFSIYLTLLDYLEPKEISDFKFPILLNTNFFHGDFFDLKAGYNEALAYVAFDFIVGNPPWKRGSDEKQPSYIKYINQRKQKELRNNGPEIAIGNKEIAQSFVLRCSDFSTSNTECALIVTSKALYNLQSSNFRRHLLSNFKLKRVFELAPVRREVFDRSNDKAIAPACILFYSYDRDVLLKENIVEHIALKPSRFFSMFKIFTITRTDYKKVQQQKLIEYDWLWKVLVYGSYLDFNFINRLKTGYQTIKDTIDDKENFIVGQGVMVGGGDENDASKLIGKTLIDTRIDIKRFWINPSAKKKWALPIVHRKRNPALYEAPVLLITEGVGNDLKSVSAVSYQDAVYKSSLTGIKGINTNTKNTLQQLSAVLNSSFFSYFNLMTFSSSGIEREQSHDDEKWQVPFPQLSNIHDAVEDIEKLYTSYYDTNAIFRPHDLIKQIGAKQAEIDNRIYSSFSLTDIERDLIDYVNEYIIPTITRRSDSIANNPPKSFKSKLFESYAKVFIERFQHTLGNANQKFVAEINYSPQIVGMLFKVIPKSDYESGIKWLNQQDAAQTLSFIAKLSPQRITDRLFVQKDIRGFEINDGYFYIFKPNEPRLWHKAIAHIDANEFSDAMLRAGRAGL